MKYFLRTMFVSTTMLVIIFYFFGGWNILSHRYTWEEMDWNQDGITTFMEFFKAGDTGKRKISDNEKYCDEYFAYKDGRPIKVICQAN